MGNRVSKDWRKRTVGVEGDSWMASRNTEDDLEANVVQDSR